MSKKNFMMALSKFEKSPLANKPVPSMELLWDLANKRSFPVGSIFNYFRYGTGMGFIHASLKRYLSSVRELYRTFGLSFNPQLDRKFFFWFLCGCVDTYEVEFVKVLKFELAAPMAIFMDNQLPEKPKYFSIIQNSSFRFFKKVTQGMGRDRAGSIAMGINNLKRVFPNLPVSYRQAMEEKHRSTISKKPCRIPNFIKKKVERITNEIFCSGWDRNYEKEISFKEASCYEKSRQFGGQLEAWREELSTYVERIPKIVITEPSGRTSLQGLGAFHDDKVSNFELRDRYRAKAECVEDPLKIRIITKNERDFGLLKGVQRAMWNWLQRYPSFILTGTPAAGEYMECFFSTLNLKSKTSLFISGDYASATDNFTPEISELILSCVMHNSELPGKLQQIAIDSITRHVIEYNHCKPVVQTNGQMMGSLLSFPVLCVYNYALWHISMEKYLKTRLSTEWGLKRVLINGDDILFVANKSLYKIWWETVSKYGLEPSMGKNFSNSHYFTINSMLFKWNYETRSAQSVAFPKIQFLYNCNKITFDKSKKELVQSTLPSLLRSCEKDSTDYQIIPFKMDSFMKRVISSGSTIYKKHDFRGLFLPSIDGGHGLTPLDGTKVHMSTYMKQYKRLYVKSRSVSDYLSKKSRPSISLERKECAGKWEQKYVHTVPTFDECCRRKENERIQAVELELRKVSGFRNSLETRSPIAQLRQMSKRFKNP